MDPFLGEIRLVGFNFAPTGWAFCNGQILSIAQNTALFSLLGTYYGGNGTTTFALPNLQSRVAIGMGQGTGLSPYTIGQASGDETITLTTQQMPSHTHAVNCNSNTGTQPSPAAGLWAVSTPATKGASAPSMYATSPNATMLSTALAASGGSIPHSNIQPVLALNFIIALQGVYPSRS